MASIGALKSLLRPLSHARPIQFAVKLSAPFSTSARNYIAALELAATDPKNKVQIYVSRTTDPFVNLSVEHYLLTKTPVDAHVLFLYTDRPSIILGRNQNPWVEVNNGMLNKAKVIGADKVELVRRRSGGGTVFHDEGNLNYSVVMPTSLFDRDRHAHMVVHALRAIGVSQAKVNERHDIVLDQSPEAVDGDTVTTVALPPDADKPLKISGSAYKLTSKKSLHHGTCLLNSPNIGTIGQYLKSPAKSYIHAFGTPSVRSPITNVGIASADFEKAVIAEFKKLYGNVKVMEVTNFDAGRVEEVAKYYAEQKVRLHPLNTCVYLGTNILCPGRRVYLPQDPSIQVLL